MTAELRICVPDDVADWLRKRDDLSAGVTDAVRACIHAEQIEDVLRAAGLSPADASDPRLRLPVDPPDRFAEGRRTLADRLAPTLPAVLAGR